MASKDKGLTNDWATGGLWDMTGHARVVTFIGAGGKTTCLRSLTRELEFAGLPVIATTTTKVFPEEQMKAWKNECPPDEQDDTCFWYVEVESKSGKWIGPPVQAVDEAILRGSLHASSNISSKDLHDLHWVIEGDGARGLHLKCWESHEPQIPLHSNCAVLVLDRALWGNVLKQDQVHRPEKCPDLIGRIWNAEQAWCYFLRSPVFASQYQHLSWVILMNGPGGMAELTDLMSNQTSGRVGPLLERPIHLRLAVGDAKEGIIQWCDLW